MRFLPTVIHGVLDYLVGLLSDSTAVYPRSAGIAEVDARRDRIAAHRVQRPDGLRVRTGSLLRIRFHLLLDAIFGLAMLLMPTLLDFPADARLTNYVLGVLALVLVAITDVRAMGTAVTK